MNAPVDIDGGYQLADMAVVGQPPAKLLKACAAIADQLHPAFARQPWIAGPDKSKDSCVLCSLTVREFLASIGFADAQVRTVATVMMAFQGENVLHSLGIGVPSNPQVLPGKWNGHMVVTCAGWLIDTTLYPSVRPAWPQLPGMLAIPLECSHPDRRIRQNGLDHLKPLADIATATDDGYLFQIVYLDNPDNRTWRRGGDARERARRLPVVKAMRDKFGAWETD